MPRGYWRVVVAVVGVALLIALLSISYSLYNSSEQQHGGYDYQPASKPLLGGPSATPGAPEKYQPYCESPDSREDSDLCAQWAAVDQVTESNRLSSVNLRLATLTLLVTVFGTLLLVWTFDETRETSRRELRAYLTMDECGVAPPVAGQVFKVRLNIKNAGQTPARKVIWHSTIALRHANSTEPFVELAPTEAPSSSVVGAGGSTYHDMPTAKPLDVVTTNQIMSGAVLVYVYGKVEYLDIFDRQHTLHYRHVYDASVHGLRIAAEGNDFD